MNWVLDADIRAFFDTLDHGWLIRFIEHRVADRRVVRLIQKWLNAGVLEDGHRITSEVGTVQGGSISPLLANVYLHYVFDLWAHRWRQRQAHGDVVVVRFADDFVVGFEHRDDAEQCLADLRERFARFGLTLHPDKTRLLEFGRHAAANRRARSEGRTGRSRCVARTSRRRTGGRGRSAFPRWRTRSSSAPSSRCGTRSTTRTSSGSRTGFDRGAAHISRWMR